MTVGDRVVRAPDLSHIRAVEAVAVAVADGDSVLVLLGDPRLLYAYPSNRTTFTRATLSWACRAPTTKGTKAKNLRHDSPR